VAVASAHETNPFAPGESPFCVKGLAYRNTIAFLAKTVGGLDKLLAEVRDPATREFLAQTFLNGGWYDALPTQPLFQAAGRLAGQNTLDITRQAAAAAAVNDINGIHRVLLKLASPEMVIERVPRAATQYYNFVTSTVEKLGPQSYRLVGEGIPAGIASIYMAVTEAFLLRAIELAGAKEPRNLWHPHKPLGVRHGVTVLQLTRDMSWK
jgi:hypothetical protein